MAQTTFSAMEDIFLRNNYTEIKDYISNFNDYEQIEKMYISLPGQHKNTETLLPHWLAFQGYNKLFTNLSDKFCEQKIKDLKDNQGCVPLHYAVWNGNHQTIAYLTSKCNTAVQYYDNEGLGILHYCCFRTNDRNQIANILLKIDNSILENVDNNGSSPLHHAVIEGRMDLVRHFYVWGANINLTNSQLDTPLHLAAYWQRHNIVQYLIDLEAKTDLQNNDLKTVLHMHLSVHEDTCKENIKSLQVIVENDPSIILTQDINGDTAIHLASKDGNYNALEMMLKTPEVKDADLNIENKDSYTPLHLAVKEQSLKTVQYLLRHPVVDINYKNGRYQETALHYASRGDNLDITKALIDAGAEINVQAFGRTPLHAATLLHKKEMVKLLIEQGADPSIKDWNGNTTEELASPRMKPIFRHSYNSSTASSASSQNSPSKSLNLMSNSCDGYIDERTIKDILDDIAQRLAIVEAKDQEVQIPDDIIAVMLDIKEKQRVVNDQLHKTTSIRPGSARLDIHDTVNKLTQRVELLESYVQVPVVGLTWNKLKTGLLRDENIKLIAGRMGRDWKNVARILSLTNPELDQIEASYRFNNPMQIFVAFCIGRDRVENDRDRFAAAFREEGYVLVAKDIEAIE